MQREISPPLKWGPLSTGLPTPPLHPPPPRRILTSAQQRAIEWELFTTTKTTALVLTQHSASGATASAVCVHENCGRPSRPQRLSSLWCLSQGYPLAASYASGCPSAGQYAACCCSSGNCVHLPGYFHVWVLPVTPPVCQAVSVRQTGFQRYAELLRDSAFAGILLPHPIWSSSVHGAVHLSGGACPIRGSTVYEVCAHC